VSGRRELITAVLLMVVLGAVVAVPFGPPRQISLDLWILSTAGWILTMVAVRLVKIAPPVPARLRGPWRRRRSPVEGPPPRFPRDLVRLEGAVLRSVGNPQTFDLQLRPRLQRVIEHAQSSRLGDGSGPDQDASGPGGTTPMLGELAWIVDPAIIDRCPTVAEIQELLDRVLVVEPLDATRLEDSGVWHR
jgi:hypothetical protein